MIGSHVTIYVTQSQTSFPLKCVTSFIYGPLKVKGPLRNSNASVLYGGLLNYQRAFVCNEDVQLCVLRQNRVSSFSVRRRILGSFLISEIKRLLWISDMSKNRKVIVLILQFLKSLAFQCCLYYVLQSFLCLSVISLNECL